MSFEYYVTTDEENMFQRERSPFTNNKSEFKIHINSKQTFQTIDGWGASFTDASAYLLDKCLSEEQQTTVMEALFDRNKGIGLSILRNPMGASDYARFIYSYDDMEKEQTDVDLTHFSFVHDEESIIPLTKYAKQINPELKLFLSPWSAPGWMKDSQKMIGGKLLPMYYETYANYFKKVIESYLLHGLETYAVTPQNEPLFLPPHYPGMEMLADEQATFVAEYLKPTFENNNINVKIFGYDHNWDRIDYPIEILDKAEKAFDGIAWHWYGGNVVNQSRVAAFYPNKEIHFTEGSGGEWIPAFEPAFSNLIRTGIDIFRNGAKSMTLWNVALDENNGPTVPGFGRSTCRGLIKVNQQTNEYEMTLDYFGLAHFSKYVHPGSVRIASSNDESIRSVAFQNENQTVVVILFNDSENGASVKVTIDSLRMDTIYLPAKSAMTIVETSNKKE
ncbi:glycoside hydrolase family 30 protein [Enterococcus sp. N249-2]